MKKTIVALALAAPALAQASLLSPLHSASPSSLDMQTSALWSSADNAESAGRMPTNFAVRGGSAPIEQALLRIIPNPYRVDLDARIPTGLVMTWATSSDWMRSLKQACANLGLKAQANWSSNTISVSIDTSSVLGRALLQPAPQHAKQPVVHDMPMVRSTAAEKGAPVEAFTGQRVIGPLEPGWYTKVPAKSEQFGAAVLDLLPTDMSSSGLEIDALNTSQVVSWSAGTRIQALRSILTQGHAVAYVLPGSVRIAPQGPSAPSSKPMSFQASGAKTASPKPALKPAPDFKLVAGGSVEQQLIGWGKQAGWTVMWNLSKDWVVPGSVDYGRDFQHAASSVINTLVSNGADLRANFYEGNKTLIVHPAGANN